MNYIGIGLLFFLIYLILNFINSPVEKLDNSSIQIQEIPRIQEISQIQEIPQIQHKQLQNKNIWEINLLEKPKYSIERELVVDDSDEKYYRSHFSDFAENGFEDYGLNVKSKGIISFDPVLDSFATFDRNEKGYLGTNAQNVHSSLVQDTIKNKYNTVKSKVSNSNKDITFEIIEYAKYLNKDYKKIQDIINQIKTRNSFIKNLNETEINVLNNSWISANKNVKEQILNELLDMTDGKSYIVCPTGVTSRIINSNIVENPESGPVKESDLRQEMLSTASKIRNELDNLLDFQNLPEIEQTNIFKEKLIQKYNKDYNGVISKDRIKKELESWIDSI